MQVPPRIQASSNNKPPLAFQRLALRWPALRWLAPVLCLLPVVLYGWAFFKVAYNVNYIAYDDITILGVIPGFEEAAWPERWRRLTDLFPEHRLVFSRSLVLFFYQVLGRVDLVWLMVVGNLCWAGCAWLFYRVFRKLGLSLWYFVPVMWLWFQIQSFENIYWGVSSLCNFGVIFFALLAFYLATHHPRRLVAALLAAVAATFTYGNGLMAFPVLAGLAWITGRRKPFFITVAVTAFIAFIYFIDFTPITQSLSLSDSEQVQEGVAGFFGFIGSLATLWGYAAYTPYDYMLPVAVVAGVVLVGLFLYIFRKQLASLFTSLWGKPVQLPAGALFGLAIILFVVITAAAVIYKRIPTDSFEGMFKGRYRMYSALWVVGVYLAAVSFYQLKDRVLVLLIPAAILLNLVILFTNFAPAVSNRRQAIAYEFNTRYNVDWLGLKMFDIDQVHFEQIRSYYGSDDPLAEGWNPRTLTDALTCTGTRAVDTLFATNGGITIQTSAPLLSSTSSYTDGAYYILKSDRHVYISSASQTAVPFQTFVRRFRYFSQHFTGYYDQATIEPGTYRLYLLVREGGNNRIYCTNRSWVETD
ncbi:hypothetical protein [Telluribacter sp.]|jgi:hypothetical protein|uniref:hypothetical protein n=1 Tax=Telluribacter sp. TaxID=1978767 RepID=UPI002E12E225|nr:hypothetical protein [Telluribacter sp.]